MKFTIEENGVIVAEAGTRQLAVMIGKMIKEHKPDSIVVVCKYGEVVIAL